MKFSSKFLVLGGLAAVYGVYASDAPIWLTTNYTYTVPAGQVVNLRAIADGAAPMDYFWLSNGIPIPGITTNTLAVIASTNTTSCPFRAVASNAFGLITNGPCFVKVLGGTPTIRLWGDAIGSNQLNVVDLLAIGKHISGATPLTNTAAGLADVNQDGVVNSSDQNIVRNAILGRANLGTVDETVVRMDDGVLPNWRVWQFGLSPNSADSDNDGVNDAIELRDHTDPLHPSSLVPYGWYVGTPPLNVFASTLDPANAAVFVSTPPVVVMANTFDPANAGLFVASPPIRVLANTYDPANVGIFVASPPVAVLANTFDPANAGVFVAKPPVSIHLP